MAYRKENNRKPADTWMSNSRIWVWPNRYPAAGAYPYPCDANLRDPAYGIRMPLKGAEFSGNWSSPMTADPIDGAMGPKRGNHWMPYGYPADPYLMQMDRDEWEERNQQEARDLEYWQQMYPEKIRKIQEYVTEQCDRVDYDDSFMYDEYPDQVAVRNLCRKIQDRMREDKLFQDDWEESPEQSAAQEDGEADFLEMNQRMMGPGPARPPKPNRPGSWLGEIVSILLFDELHRRRCRPGRHCRFYR